MKTLSAITIVFSAFALLTPLAHAEGFKGDMGLWTIEQTPGAGLTVSHSGKVIFNRAYAELTYNVFGENREYSLNTLNAEPTVDTVTVTDEFGTSTAYVFSYQMDNAVVKHTLSFPEGEPFMLASLSVESTQNKTLQSRYMKVLGIDASSTPLNGASNRAVWVPFDNDGHLKYEVYQLKNNREMTSHEVGYVFDGDSRRGIIAGSVDHDSWKSGVTIAGTNGYKIEKFDVVSGHTSSTSRDILPHGKVKGQSVRSARFFIGVYDDWRRGLNEFADANTKVAPRAVWEAGNPIGWSSWGVQQNYINYDGVLESATFMHDNLYESGFHDNDGRITISLDAFNEDNISAANLYKLGTKIFSEGEYKDGKDTKEGMNMILGEYGGHLVAWQWALDSKLQGTGLNGQPDYTVRDVALRVNGNVYPMTGSGCAVDPTHPGVKANLEFTLKKYATNGVKYIKMDFLNAGICEGDSWYDPDVTTGVQAYNYGMKLLYEEAAKYGMYIVESISPIFPYQYAHGRRTCCDRFSEISESEYVMNAMTYGWWTDRLYTVNDPDQLVMCKGGHGAKETLGENRARATSGMATGAFIFGDNFSDNVFYTDNQNGHRQGDVVGYPEESRKRAPEIMGNRDINEYVRTHTGSFMPIDGHKPSTGQSAESSFMKLTDDALYVAVFNWNTIFASNGEIAWSRLDVNPQDIVEIKELWTGETFAPNADALEFSVPAKDARVYRMAFSNFSSGDDPEESAVGVIEESPFAFVKTGPKSFHVSSEEKIQKITIFELSGKLLMTVDNCSLSLDNLAEGIYFADVVLASGYRKTVKFINN